MTAFIQVVANRAGNGRLAQELAEITGVQEVHQVAGEDGYLLKLRVADNAELGLILRDELAALPGVQATRTTIVLNTIKETRKLDLNR